MSPRADGVGAATTPAAHRGDTAAAAVEGGRPTELSVLVGRPPLSRRTARKLSHLIARDMRRMILRGELAPGQALASESDLLQAFDVSRDTLREALRILESEALIHIRRGRGGGAVVQRPHPRAVTRHVALLLQVRGATIGDVHEVRRIMEPPAAGRLAGVAPDDLAAIAELHDLEQSRLDQPMACATALVAFDQAVFRLTGNTTIAVVSSVFRELVVGQAFLASVDGRRADGLTSLVDRHGAVVAALASGDAAEIETAWSAYLSATATILGRRTLDRPFDVAPLWRAQGAGDPSGAPDKMAASIARDIRLRIAEGRLSEGDQLPPMPELAAEFGVSRPTIRECLRILEVEGLVDLRTGSRTGARILEPSTDTAGRLASVMLAAARTRMIDVVEARQLVEPPVIELMAERAEPRDLAALSERVASLESMVQDTPAFVDEIAEVERQAFAVTRNPAICVAVDLMRWVNVRCRQEVLMRAVSVPQVLRSNRRASRRLAECVAAAERGDARAAGLAWAEHLQAMSSYFRSAYRDRLIVDLFD
jgi:DNA-binding FadR family transcriptional regulator